MSLQVEKLEKNMAKLTIEVPAEEFDAAIKNAYNKNKNKFSIPGFRKGKAPLAMLEKMYGAGIFYEDAANEVIDASYPKAAEESKEEIVSTPEIKVTQIEKGKAFIYEATVALKPEVTLGEYKGVEVKKAEAVVTDEDVENELTAARKKNGRLIDVEDGAIIGSVVPPVTSLMREAIRKVTGQEALVVNVDMNIGLEVLMDNPSSVGTDLIVGAVAGINRYPVPLILIDMGTATTICVVSENKQYIGGMILPGIGVSMNSLTSRTAQLPRISLDPPKRLIGKNTVECMQSGALYGNASCIDGMVDRIQEELGQEATIVATGGLAKRIIPLCRHHIELDDELLLRGLWIIYEKNK